MKIRSKTDVEELTRFFVFIFLHKENMGDLNDRSTINDDWTREEIELTFNFQVSLSLQNSTDLRKIFSTAL